MTDLYDELGQNTSNKIGLAVHGLGGDLYDEVAIRNRQPDKINPELMKRAVDDERKRVVSEINNDLGLLETIGIGIGRGAMNIGRALGLAAPESDSERTAWNDLTSNTRQANVALATPWGGVSGVTMSPKAVLAEGAEITGEALPFLPLGVGAGAIRSIGLRILANAGIGAAEGGIITKGRGGSYAETATGAGIGGAIAGSAEAIIPVLGRLGGQIFRRLRRKPTGPLVTENGIPTPEFQQALDDTGITFEQLTKEAFAEVNQSGIVPEQAARKALFESEGIPSTLGDITQDFSQQAQESRLMSMASGDAGEPLRQTKLRQSNIFTDRVQDLVDSLGVPAEMGDMVKTALISRRSALKSQKNALYREIADKSPNLMNMPFMVDGIDAAIPDRRTVRRLTRLVGPQVKAVDELLVEFGIDNSQEAVEAFTKAGGDITPLSLGNIEDFRQALNVIERSDNTGAIQVYSGPIKKALDAEAELIDNQIKAAGVKDLEVLDTIKQARATVRELKTEFSPESISGRLINVKRDGVTPIIEASQVNKQLLGNNKPIEHLQRTISNLKKSGKEGAEAIRYMQASVIMDAFEQALKAPSRKTSGVMTVRGDQFSKALDAFGEDKLKVLFADNQEALNRLMRLKKIGFDMTAADAATPKGSAPVILDAMRRIGRVPGISEVVSLFEYMARNGMDRRAVNRAIEANPTYKRIAPMIERDFPALASAFGIAVAVTEEDQ